MKILQPASRTVWIKSVKNSQLSRSSTPMRHLIETGIETASCIALKQSATTFFSFMRHAPKFPFCTRSDGQPQFKLTSLKPAASTSFDAAARSAGLLPPSCSTAGCSNGSCPRNKSLFSQCRSPVDTTISLYSKICLESKRKK